MDRQQVSFAPNPFSKQEPTLFWFEENTVRFNGSTSGYIGSSQFVVDDRMPTITVLPVEDIVKGFSWTPGSTVTLTVGTYTASKTSSTETGYVDFETIPVDITPGMVVKMSDGTYTRSHTVIHLEVTTVDTISNLVNGTANPGSLIISACDAVTCGTVTPVASLQGIWTADFNSQFDLIPGTEGYIYQSDEDLNTTAKYWSVPNPRFGVNLTSDQITGSEWLPNSTVNFTIGSSSGLTLSDSSGNFSFDLAPYDILPGQTAEVSDGANTKTHTLTNLSITKLDKTLDRISGTAAPGITEVVANYGIEMHTLTLIADSSGIWTADFSGLLDISNGTFGQVHQYDVDGDWTTLDWEVLATPYDDISLPSNITNIPSKYNLDTRGFTLDPSEPTFATCGQVETSATVWYRFSPTTTLPVMQFSLDTFGSDYDTMLGVWSGLPGNLSPITCNDDANGTVQSQVSFAYTAGVNYYIGIAQKGNSESGGNLKLQVTNFFDANGSSWFWKWVEGFFARGITTGCALNPFRYCPDRAVTRAEMAVFILRALNGTSYVPADIEPDTFADVPVITKEWMEPWIEQLYTLGITTGCEVSPNLKYCPDRPVTRAEMAVFILRALNGTSYAPVDVEPDIFADLTAEGKDWMEPWIEQFYTLGITTGCQAAGQPLKYCPEQPVTRAEMAVFIDRAFGFPQLP